ncbi:hypothetical protein [Sabulibacter ruber]|uniref:hypothetical protein n=1 Tax=Sabulibacter ruber TaxID=2811901 RepID=UPI001A95AB04|nr:hypothetical protein [Sabulibacter ruber]
MRHLLSFSILLLAVLQACSSDPELQFEQPQPLLGEEEKAIPAALVGQYQNPQDSSLLLITTNAVVQQEQFICPTAIQELTKDSVEYRIEKGHFYSSENPEGVPVLRQTPDSLYLLFRLQDTLYSAEDRYRLRKFKGLYVLNKQIAPKRWKVLLLKPNGRKSLQLQQVADSLDRVKLKEIITLREAENLFLANPSQKELRKFLRQGGFRQRTTFLRVTYPAQPARPALSSAASQLTNRCFQPDFRKTA